jgi:hypothetical protein
MEHLFVEGVTHLSFHQKVSLMLDVDSYTHVLVSYE